MSAACRNKRLEVEDEPALTRAEILAARQCCDQPPLYHAPRQGDRTYCAEHGADVCATVVLRELEAAR